MNKEQVKWKDKTVIVDYEINPWEFKGHFANGSNGIRLTFKWNEVERIEEKYIRDYDDWRESKIAEKRENQG